MDIRSIGDEEEGIRERLDASRLSSRANQMASDRARRIAENYVERAHKHIEDQDLDWAPLDPDYRQWKEDQGLDTRIWIATGELKSQIEVTPARQTTTADGETVREGYFGGITRDKMHDGVPTFIIARTLEFGYPPGGIPARPLFRPSFEEAVAMERRRDEDVSPNVEIGTEDVLDET